MSYCLLPHESVEESAKRIAREQIDQAIAELRDPELELAATVHQVRKRCKKIRGLIRLVRPQFKKTYRLENAWYRDTARELSYARDAHVLLETHDRLLSHYKVESRNFEHIRAGLTNRRDGMVGDPRGMEKCLQIVAQRMKSGRDRVRRWSIGDNAYSAVSGGLKQIYKRARKSMNRAFMAPSDRNFHDWRKQVKYHWYHARILRPLNQDGLGSRCGQLESLAELLGDEHDLCVLRQTFAGLPREIHASSEDGAYLRLIDQRRKALRRDAALIGGQLFTEKGKEFAGRIGGF